MLLRPLIPTILLWLASSAGPAVAATSGSCRDLSNLQRPSLGLVLGGGGARGAAHIGVIRKLEELKIPVDYVAGTSMGSLVGALYATGMSADELEETINNLEWSELFNDNTRRADRPLRRKRDDDLSLYGPKLGIGRDSTLLPSGALSGQKISFLFESLVQNRVHVHEFDQLPIPFRAVAADIVTGEAVVLGQGDLAQAMRASMSVPGAFNPVVLGDHLLVDGGIANNLPMNVVRDMGAQRLIAVEVGSPLTARDKLDNLLPVLAQMSTLLIRSNVQAQLATLGADDLLIEPAIGRQVSSADFAKSEMAIAIGYAAADQLEAELLRYAVSDAEYQAFRDAVASCRAPSSTIQFVRLDNRSRFSDAVILENLHLQPGQPLNTKTLEEDVQRIHALGFLELVRYEVVTENQQTGVVLHVTQDSRGTAFVEWGLDIAGDERDNSLNLRVGYLKTDLDALGSELRILTQLGDDPGIKAEIYKPLDTRQRWILNPKLFASRSDLNTFDPDGKALESFEIDELGGSVILAREFQRHAALFTGIGYREGEIEVEVGDPNIDSSSYDDGQWFAGLQWDRFDDLYFPGAGTFFEARYQSSLDSLGADEEYEQVTAVVGMARTFGRHALIGIGRYATTLDDDAPLHAQFRAGGFNLLSGFNDAELRGQHFGMAMLAHRYQMSRSAFLPAYVGYTIEFGNTADDQSDLFADGIFNGSLYGAYRSPIGPLYIGYGFAEGGRNRYFLRIGSFLGRGDLSR